MDVFVAKTSKTLSGVFKFKLVGICVCVCMYGGTVWHNSTTCHIHIMWAQLGQSHFLYVPTISNIVTNGANQ